MAGTGEAVAVASCCLNCCCKQFSQYIFDAERYMSDLRNELHNLAAVRGDVERDVELTRQRGQPSTAAETWVTRSISWNGAAQKLLRDHEAMCMPRVNLWSRYKLGKRAVRKLRKARELIQEKPNLEAALRTGLHVQERQIETTVVGMDPYLNKAMEHIDGATVGVIGICGMGGVGKTTLLRKIHDEFLPGKPKRMDFGIDKVVWAVVYKKSITAGSEMDTDVVRLQNDIAKQLGLELENEPADDSCSREVLEQRAQPIYEYLLNKSFLVLLDDLWRPFELKCVGVPDPSPSPDGVVDSQRKKHKLVVTSRSSTVCSEMKATAGGLISVLCLEPVDARRLFEFNATSRTIASHPAIRELAEQVMAECQGLPLALNTIGKALSSKSGDPNPWIDALRKLQNAGHVEIAGMEAANAAMLHRLKISYDCLPSERERNCLLSCCLWPEDYCIDKVKLTECWLGLGIITSSSSTDNDGMSIITSLEEMHLLQPGDDQATQVKMHDTIRDMSLWISSDCGNMKSKWLVKAGVRLKTAQRVLEQLEEASDDTERVSLMGNVIEELPSAIPNLPAAKVFMLQRNEALRVVPGGFLRSAQTLTYLDLSNTGVEEIPGEIGLLRGLEYLNLSESQITSLPNELSDLTKLRYLLAGGAVWLKTIPYGIVSSLTQLETLDVFGSKYATWALDSNRHACLEEFEANGTFLKWLGITVGSVQVLRRLAMCNNVRTRRLCLKQMNGPDPSLHVQPSSLQALLGRLDILQSVQTLKAESCVKISKVLIDGGSESGDNRLREYYCLPMLEKLELIGMNKLEDIQFNRITPVEFFPRLQSVKITLCNQLKNLNWALHLPELLHLDLQFCRVIQALIEDTGSEHPTNQATFPVLKTVTIHSLASLTSLCSGRSISFPALEVLEITQCPKLSQLCIRPQSKLREIRGGDDWWQNLEWNEPSLREDLEPYFSAQVENQ